MSKTIKQFAVSFAITASLLALVTAFPVIGFAQIQAEAPSAILSQTGGEGNIKNFINTIVNFLLGFLGFICVLFIIYAGFILVTSSGNEEKMGEAKKIILYAFVGIIIIFASYALVNTILGAPTGQSVVSS